MKGFPENLYKTHDESTYVENLTQLVVYLRNAKSVGIKM
jgi:hypothetical protein